MPCDSPGKLLHLLLTKDKEFLDNEVHKNRFSSYHSDGFGILVGAHNRSHRRTPGTSSAGGNDSVGQMSISLTDGTVSLVNGNLTYKDRSGTVIEREATAGFVEAGGNVSVVTPTRIILTAPPLESETSSPTMRTAQGLTGSWDECMSGYIAGGRIGGLALGPGGIFGGILLGAAAAFAACNGLPRM